MLKNITYIDEVRSFNLIKKIDKGIYENLELDFENNITNKIIRNPILENGKKPYGICDSYEQVLYNFEEIKSSKKEYFILLKRIKKEDITKEKEYKYSSWGGYYGSFPIKEDFFSLEEGLDQIFAFHIMEINEDHVDLTIPMNKFSVDGINTVVLTKTFDGKDINLGSLEEPLALEFKNPNNNEISFETSNLITNFGFNGTALLTPSAFFNSNLNVNSIKSTDLESELLLLNISKLKDCNATALKELIEKSNVDTTKKYIIVFYTGYMSKLENNYTSGNPDSDFWAEQSNRPYLTIDAVEYLNELNIAKAYIIDNVSFEASTGMANNFPVTSLLVNHNEDTKDFTPLIYHIIIDKQNLEYIQVNRDKIKIRIELGNVPTGNISGYSVKVILV